MSRGDNCVRLKLHYTENTHNRIFVLTHAVKLESIQVVNKKNRQHLYDNYLILCGQRWIRTTEGVSQQIYSLPHLATLVFAHSKKFV